MRDLRTLKALVDAHRAEYYHALRRSRRFRSTARRIAMDRAEADAQRALMKLEDEYRLALKEISDA